MSCSFYSFERNLTSSDFNLFLILVGTIMTTKMMQVKRKVRVQSRKLNHSLPSSLRIQ